MKEFLLLLCALVLICLGLSFCLLRPWGIESIMLGTFIIACGTAMLFFSPEGM